MLGNFDLLHISVLILSVYFAFAYFYCICYAVCLTLQKLYYVTQVEKYEQEIGTAALMFFSPKKLPFMFSVYLEYLN